MADIAAPLTFTSGNEVKTEEQLLQGSFKAYEPDKDDQEVLRSIMYGRVEQQMIPCQSEYHTEWDDSKDIFEAVIRPIANRPNVRIPWSHTVIDAALAEEIDAFPDIEVDTQEDDDKPKIPVIDAAKKYALDNAGWDRIKIDARRCCRVYGFCPVRIYYARETRLIKERIPVKGDDGLLRVEFREVYDFPEDDIKLEVIDNPRRFMIDDNARDINEAEDCALFTEVSWNMFRQKVQHDRRYKNVQFVFPGAQYYVSGETNGVVTPGADQVSTSKKVKILEYWNKATDRYIMIANGVVIRDTCLVDDHKELPFAVLHMYRRPHSFYSKGVPKILESVEATYNTIIAAEVQATKLAFPILTTMEDAGIDPKAVAPYPGIVLEGAMEKMKLEQLGSVPTEAYRLKEKLEQLIVWITGINYQQLFSDKQSDRVGVEALKKESMLSRVRANLRENEANFVVRLGNLLVQDIMQYYPAPKIRKLMSSEDVKELADFDFEKDGKQLVKDDDGKVMGVIERRKIPVRGMTYTEERSSDGKMLTLRPRKSNDSSWLIAKPEYIRTKAKMDIHAVRPSAMGSSKEAQKLVLMELANHGLDVNVTMSKLAGVDPATGQPKPSEPIWNIPYLERRIAEINDLPPEKALMTGDPDKGKEAAEKFKEVAGPIISSFHEPIESQMAPQQPQVPPGSPELTPQDSANFAMMTQG